MALENLLVLHQYNEVLNGKKARGEGGSPDGKRPYANTFAGTPACLWVSPPVTF
jgi:hypothetical protein